MSETTELSDLDAARDLLATLEAGRGALLGLASAHLPFARALALHRSVAEGGADLVAAEEAVTLRAELYWQAWRGAARGEVGEIEEEAPAPRPAPERPRVRAEAPERGVAPPREAVPPRETIQVPPRETIPVPPRETIQVPPRETIQVPEPAPRAAQPAVSARWDEPVPGATPAPAALPELAEPLPAPHPVAEPVAEAGPRPLDGQVGVATRADPGRVRVIDPVTESPLLNDILGVQPEPPPPAAVDFDRLPFEPISELDYVDDDASEVTQVAKVSAPPLHPVGAPTPGEGRAIPDRPDLIVDDFNEISELEELDPGEFGLAGDRGHLEFPGASPGPASVSALPVAAHRAEDEEVLAQGDAPILPEFNNANSDDLSLSFEVGGRLRAAPRLTDEEEVARPAAPAAAPRRDTAAEHALVQRALGEAENALSRGDLARSIQFYSDALDIVPGNVEAHIGRGRAHLELGDYSSAMSDFQRAEDLSPNDPESHLAMGDLYYNRKEYKRAIDFYDEAVELDGQHAMAKCKRGLAHYYRKNYKQAFQDLQRATALDPNIPNIHKYVQMAMKKMEGKG